MKNILFITGWYPLKERPNFGMFVHEHAKSLKEAGHNVKVIQLWPFKSKNIYRKEIKRFKRDGVEVISIRIFSMFSDVFYYSWRILYGMLKRVLSKELANFKYDLIHANVVYPAGFWSEKLAKDEDKPFVLTEHWSKSSAFLERSYYGGKARKVYEEAAYVFFVSHYLKARLQKKLDLPSQKTEVIPNVVDTDLFCYDETPKQGKDYKVNFLCVTNFFERKVPDKLPEVLVEALKLMNKKQLEHVHVTFIGPGDENGSWQKKKLPKELRSYFTFCGYREKEFVAKKMKESDVLLHPTNHETFGIVVAEALCTGLPCIVSDIPAMQELVNEQNGMFVQQNTGEAWKEAMLNYLNNPIEGKREIARRNDGKFNSSKIGQSYNEAYNRM